VARREPARVDTPPVVTAPAPKRKLSYKEQRELESLPGDLEKMEAEQTALTAKMCAPDYHRATPDDMRRDAERAAELATSMSTGMDRWAELDALAATLSDRR
jgi:ATP-binding cassette subfamily F protein uup